MHSPSTTSTLHSLTLSSPSRYVIAINQWYFSCFPDYEPDLIRLFLHYLHLLDIDGSCFLHVIDLNPHLSYTLSLILVGVHQFTIFNWNVDLLNLLKPHPLQLDLFLPRNYLGPLRFVFPFLRFA